MTEWPVCPDCYESDTDHCGDCWCCDEDESPRMRGAYVVDVRGALYGPFLSRHSADEWAGGFALSTAEAGEITSWTVRSVRFPTQADDELVRLIEQGMP